MKFWLKTPNNIYKNWMNSHIDSIMFTVSKLEISFGTIQLEHPVYVIYNVYLYIQLCAYNKRIQAVSPYLTSK